MSGPYIITRRDFLKQCGAFSALSVAASMDQLGLASASAQGTGYKALVCLFMFGGVDSNSLLLPANATSDRPDSYATYDAVRPVASMVNVSSALFTNADGTVNHRINPANLPGQQFALHPALQPTNSPTAGPNRSVAQLFRDGNAAVVANVGTLVETLDRTTYRNNSKRRPSNLFSHSDQQQQNMSSITQSSITTGVNGWGGRLADKVSGLNQPASSPMSMSFSGAQTFGTGVTVRTLALPSSGNFGFQGDNPNAAPGSAQFERAAARNAILAAGEANAIVSASQNTSLTALNSSARLSPIISSGGSANVTGPFTGLNTGLSNQLRAVARVIENRATLGHARQIFFVSFGGFDTHSGQGQWQPPTPQVTGVASLFQQMGNAISAFQQAMVNMGAANDVTLFTLSDFNRTFKSNGQGTDHAWGGHNLVVGGAVNGNRMYGTFPNLALSGPSDTDSAGRWIPTTALEQYGATLGRWFGVSNGDLAQVFPNLNRFGPADLGFMT